MVLVWLNTNFSSSSHNHVLIVMVTSSALHANARCYTQRGVKRESSTSYLMMLKTRLFWHCHYFPCQCISLRNLQNFVWMLPLSYSWWCDQFILHHTPQSAFFLFTRHRHNTLFDVTRGMILLTIFWACTVCLLPAILVKCGFYCKASLGLDPKHYTAAALLGTHGCS